MKIKLQIKKDHLKIATHIIRNPNVYDEKLVNDSKKLLNIAKKGLFKR